MANTQHSAYPNSVQVTFDSQLQQYLIVNRPDIPKKVQAILPALSEFSESDYHYLYNLLINIDPSNQKINSHPIGNQKNNRVGRHLGMMNMSDDFTEELDDDVWGF